MGLAYANKGSNKFVRLKKALFSMKIFTPIATLLCGLLIGGFFSFRVNISDYEAPILIAHGYHFKKIDACLEKEDLNCLKKVLSILASFEAERADALLTKGFSGSEQTEVKEAMGFFAKFEQKYE